MIDPTKITNYNLNKNQLEEVLLFWLLVAGKNARTTSRLLDLLLRRLHWCSENDTEFDSSYRPVELQPFKVIRSFTGDLALFLKETGFGCSTIKARGMKELVESGFDLTTCSVEQLETIYGIGPKTARCFVMHSRENARYAGLDTHILKWLPSLGYKVPKGTPSGKNYLRLERLFLQLADLLNKTPAVLDLEVWNAYSTGGNLPIDPKLSLPKQEEHGSNKRDRSRKQLCRV